MKVVCLCHTCARKHIMDFDPVVGPGAGFSDWLTKHPDPHVTEFRFPRRRQRDGHSRPPHNYRGYLDNADVKTAYAASAAITITLASLAASSTLLAGRESTAVDNGASNKYLDELLAGFYRTGSSNLQAGTIRTAVVGAIDDTPTWPDVFDGTNSTETVSLQAIYDSVCRIASDIATDTSQRTYPWGPVAVAGFFGGVLPDQWLIFVAHNAHTSTNAWSSTEGDHGIKRTPVYATVA